MALKTCSKCHLEKDESWIGERGPVTTCQECRDYNTLYRMVKTPSWDGNVPERLQYLWEKWQTNGNRLEFTNDYDELCFDCIYEGGCVRQVGDINRASDHKYPLCLISIARTHDIEPERVVRNIKVVTGGLQLSENYGNILITE